MSQDLAVITDIPQRQSHRNFLAYAKLIGAITFLSRLLGMTRESIAANYFGGGIVYSAFTFAFTIPNLFRKLLGEGALSAAFIPLYAQAVKSGVRNRVSGIGDDKNPKPVFDPEAQTRRETRNPSPETQNPKPDLSANDFASASVNLLCSILLFVTVLGEIVLLL